MFSFSVRGQQGEIPKIGLGTATLHHEICSNAVCTAIKLGYRAIDTALLYNNQEAVGKGIRQAIEAGFVTREELFVTTKIGFYPEDANGKNTWKAIDECLTLLGLDYVDLILIHNPASDIEEYRASSATWAALEEARENGKCRWIGVSNYTTDLLKEVETYASKCMYFLFFFLTKKSIFFSYEILYL
eukprot:GSMAST32.ASY1.ANO1.136.1 assembled CDS